MTIAVGPATIVELAAHAAGMSQRDWRIAKEMWHGGEALAFRAADQTIVALAGFYPLDADHTDAEAWFWAVPDTRQNIVGLAYAMRLTCASAPYRSMVTVCRSMAGQRLARFVGFRPAVETSLGEVWVYGADLRSLRRRQLAVAATAGSQPAPLAGATGGPTG